MTNFKDVKFYFESMFATKWAITPIHYAGQEFDAIGIDKWINISYNPQRSESCSVSGNSFYIYGTLYIPCWADNDVDVMELTDAVIKFIGDNIETPYKITNTSIIDHGWNDASKSYTIISIGIKNLIENCS
ncbi:MAG: hypothetical protein DRG30_06150 [Epsilonproteobacteria bacterium]|nr:MAG: hypothetical protein DRG30_06150 [Campylobacterota bacterium]